MKRGILFVNLGSPKSLSITDVRNYLSEFLMDKYVIDIPYILRLLLVHCLIIPFRKYNTYNAYAKIWGDNEISPLINYSIQFQLSLQKQLQLETEVAMRYQSPSIQEAVSRLYSRGVCHILLFPMYPHYAISSFKTVVELFQKIVLHYPQIQYKVVPPLYNKKFYINALCKSIQPYLSNNYDTIIFSYHGIPERHITKLDKSKKQCLFSSDCCFSISNQSRFCYRHQVFETTRLVAKELNLQDSEFIISFQSRIGKGWLQPYTDIEISRLLAMGKKRIAVVCPSFLVDCLETLEEIAIRERNKFLSNGGEQFDLIPCLNTNSYWIKQVSNHLKKEYKDFLYA